jgi:hypothetical protein
MNFVTEVIRYRGSQYPFILLGDLNVDLDWLEDIHADTIAAHLAIYGFQDVGDHFKHPRGRWTWSQPTASRRALSLKSDWLCYCSRHIWFSMLGYQDSSFCLTQIIMQSWPKLPLANYIFIVTCDLLMFSSSIPFSKTIQWKWCTFSTLKTKQMPSGSSKTKRSIVDFNYNLEFDWQTCLCSTMATFIHSVKLFNNLWERIDADVWRKLVEKLKWKFNPATFMAPLNFYVAGIADVVGNHQDPLAKIWI